MIRNTKYIINEEELNVPVHLNFGKFILDRIRVKNEEVALENFETGEKTTYKGLTQLAVNLAVALAKLGVGIGDTVALGSELRKEWISIILGIVFTGATYTPHDISIGRAVLKHELTITQPKYFICSNLFWRTHGDILKAFGCIQMFITLDDDDDECAMMIPVTTLMTKDVDVDRFEPVPVQGQTHVAMIMYSSGTTGMPKGVQLTHLNCILDSQMFSLKDESLKIAYVCGTWYHTHNMFMTLSFLLLGKKAIYIKVPDRVTILKCIQDQQVDTAILAPVIVEYMLSQFDELKSNNLNSLKVMFSTAAPLSAKAIEQVKKRLPNLQCFLQCYGMTETGEITSESWGVRGPKPGSVGMALPGITLKVVDPDKNEALGPYQCGEIRVKGPTVMKGYLGVDPSTYLDEEGFFKTGDLGYYDEDKYLFFVERMKEIICYVGFQIAPAELEAVLLLHPAVKDAGVVGKPVPNDEEIPMAFVVKQPGSNVTEEELIKFVALEVSPHMQLRGGIKFIEEIPRNPTGKLLRRRLKELVTEMA